jgi:hypothetical protein
MISDKAVEAAARGIWEARPMTRVHEAGSPNYGAAQPWDEIKQYHRDRCITLARAALEAAAPHMLAPGWLEGYREGELDGALQRNGHEPPDQRNPYMSQA